MKHILEKRVLFYEIIVRTFWVTLVHIFLCCQPENILSQKLISMNQTITRASWNATAQSLFFLNLNDDNISQLIDHMDSLKETVSKETIQYLTTQCIF